MRDVRPGNLPTTHWSIGRWCVYHLSRWKLQFGGGAHILYFVFCGFVLCQSKWRANAMPCWNLWHDCGPERPVGVYHMPCWILLRHDGTVCIHNMSFGPVLSLHGQRVHILRLWYVPALRNLDCVHELPRR